MDDVFVRVYFRQYGKSEYAPRSVLTRYEGKKDNRSIETLRAAHDALPDETGLLLTLQGEHICTIYRVVTYHVTGIGTADIHWRADPDIHFPAKYDAEALLYLNEQVRVHGSILYGPTGEIARNPAEFDPTKYTENK